MQKPSRDEYLEQEVRTASPEKLQLLLIEAAIRRCQRAQQHWLQNEDEQAGEAILRAQEIVSHLLGGLAADPGSPLAKRVAAIYVYMARSLSKAHLERDEQSLKDTLRILEIERETWRQVCQKLGNNQTSSAPVAPHFAQPRNAPSQTHSSGFSWHA